MRPRQPGLQSPLLPPPADTPGGSVMDWRSATGRGGTDPRRGRPRHSGAHALPKGDDPAGATDRAEDGGAARPRRLALVSLWSRAAPENWRVRWRLAAMISVPVVVAAVLGGLEIHAEASNAFAYGRVQYLVQFNDKVVQLTQALEDERGLAAGHAANRSAGDSLATRLQSARAASSAAAETVVASAAGVGSGYPAAIRQDLSALLDSIGQLNQIRQTAAGSSSAQQVVTAYTESVIQIANAFSAVIGDGANDPDLQASVATSGSLLRVEDDMSVQRAILFGALSSPTQTLTPVDLGNLEQAQQRQTAEQSVFNTSTSAAGRQEFSNTVRGPQVAHAASQEATAESLAASDPALSLTAKDGNLNAASWYANMTVTIDRTRNLVAQLNAAITGRAETLRSQAAQSLLVTSLITVALLLLVLAVSLLVARSLIRPLRKLRADALDVAGRRLPEMVQKLSQVQEAQGSTDVEPIGVTSTEEIGEVARAFDQVHNEAVRLAAGEAMLRSNMNAMFINLSRRSQSLIERQLSVIDSLEQGEQDPDRLSGLFRLDHLATRMRRNSENLLVLAGHDATRQWSGPVPLVDVLRAAVSEIEQYERVKVDLHPGIVVIGQAVSDMVHLVAEILENATTFSPANTRVRLAGHSLSSGGVLLNVSDYGVGISDEEIAQANQRLESLPVVDVGVSRRMGLFVVGRLAARHGIKVRLQRGQTGGLTALIWLPGTVAESQSPEPLDRLRHFKAGTSSLAPSHVPGAGA
jgi:signal transduction histidine kinase